MRFSVLIATIAFVRIAQAEVNYDDPNLAHASSYVTESATKCTVEHSFGGMGVGNCIRASEGEHTEIREIMFVMRASAAGGRSFAEDVQVKPDGPIRLPSSSNR